MRYLKFVMGWVLAVLLAACGGGGNPGSTTTTTTTTTSPTLTLSLVNAAGTVLSTNSISKSANYYAKAVVLDAGGNALANQLVTFSTDYTIATLAGNAAAATVLTDSSGVAKVAISPLTLTTTGAATLTASATTSGAAVSGTLNFSTAASNVTLSGMTTSPTTIGALETSAVTVVGSVDGTATSGVVVAFAASCGSFSPSSATTNSSGIASSTYQSVSGCGSSMVTLTSSATGATAVTKTIAITAARAANIVFTSATPTTMYVSSAASGNKTSVLKFRVVDSNSTGMASQSVIFSLSSASIAAGVKFSVSGSSSTANQTVSSDGNGDVFITVAAGTLPTTVTVTATLASDSTVYASSIGVIVTTGAATQNAASLSATKLSIEAWNTDGVTSSLTMRLADRMGNPVPNGTSVNFVASAGLVTGSCTTTSSACTVTYTSQGTRPINGRVSILAYLDGEESFIDLDGDNVWQSGETFYDVGKAYLDIREDGTWVSGEQIIDTSTNSSTCVTPTNTYPAMTGTCDGTWSSAVRVRKETIITLATSDATILGVTRSSSDVRGFVTPIIKTANGFTVWVHDTNPYAPYTQDSTIGSLITRGTVFGQPGLYNAMPTGSTVTAAITSSGAVCTVIAVSPNVVTNSPNGDLHDIVLSGDSDCTTVSVKVTVTTPASVSTTVSF